PQFADMGSLEFSKFLLSEAKVAVSPGIGFGEHGEGYVRIALCENAHRTRQAIRSIKAMMGLGNKKRALTKRSKAAAE
ncbi:MAG: aminotransferase, partial [Rhodospirillaceae bacterium]|nr:aminotransferase [Rhodospirillaceae bacterium]